MKRLIDAVHNSVRAFGWLARHEAAFRQELALLVVSLPLAWLLAGDWRGFALLVGSILLLVLVEVLNTGIEAACNALTRDFSAEIQLAKDCGSLAVLIAILLALGVWAAALADRLYGLAG